MTFTFTEDQFVALVNESPTFRKHVIALATPESDRIPELLKELKTRIANTYSPENKIGRIKKLRELVQTEPRFQVLFVGKLVSYGDGTSTTVGLAESKLFIETQMGDL
jgi:hypothetical protein